MGLLEAALAAGPGAAIQAPLHEQLWRAAERGDLGEVTRIVEGGGANIDAVNNVGTSNT